MMMGNIPPNLLPAPNQIIQLSPYNGADADMIIARVEQRNARSPSARSDISTAPSSVNLTNVSPAVSLMLLAAVNAGPPGAMGGIHGIGGINGIGIPNGLQGANGHPHGFPRRDSQGSLRSVGSQLSLVDAYGFGASASGYGLGVGTGMTMGSLTASSSWSNISPQFIPTTLNPYHDYPVAPSPRAHHIGKHAAATAPARQGLEDIAEATSHEEISHAGSQERLPPATDKPTASSNTASELTAPPTSPAPPVSRRGNPNVGGVTRSPSSGSSSERATSPGLSPPTLSKRGSLDSLVKTFGEMGISSSSDGSAPGGGLRTPPASSPPSSTRGTPPRIGNPGKRMLSHALGIRHPGLPPRVIAGVKEQAT
jgi:hypothetical protein